MVNKIQIRENVVEYLNTRGREYDNLSPPHRILLEPNARIEWGVREGQREDLYVASYELGFRNRQHLVFVMVSSASGEVLYSQGPSGIIESNEGHQEFSIEEEKTFI